MAEFKVDTRLFRELGELLVGRDSTALAELIKNSYDADATDVWVSGTNLGSPEELGEIRVRDNGIGMTVQDFERGFLTIAARSKADGPRYSPLLHRHYTGAKGVGRLAAHKLAAVIDVRSRPRPFTGPDGHEIDRGGGVRAHLDWDEIESFESFDQLDEVLLVRPLRRPAGKIAWGTTVTLTRLRRRWTDHDIATFVQEVRSYEPAPVLFAPAAPGGEPHMFWYPPLFGSGLRVRDAAVQSSDPRAGKREGNFRVHLEEQFDIGDDWASSLVESAQYVLEIESTAEHVRFGVTRTDVGERRLHDVDLPLTTIDTVTLAPLTEGPRFASRIFIRSGARAWNRQQSGVRVFMEGFRVLPYGDDGNDWLGIDEAYSKRTRELVQLKGLSDEFLFGSEIPNEGLTQGTNTGFLGAVFLTETGSHGLQMLVNREGFVPGPVFSSLQATIERGIQFSTRVRARDNQAIREAASSSRRRSATSADRDALREQVEKLDGSLRKLTVAVRRNDNAQVHDLADSMVDQARSVAEITSDVIAELTMIRVLAGVGTQMAAFVHELRQLVAVTAQAQQALEPRRDRGPGRTVTDMAQARRILDELRRALERQASYLTDVTSADARRRRSAQRVRERVDAVFALLEPTADARGVSLLNEVDDEVRTRPMFRAELTSVLNNLTTNAIRAAAVPGENEPPDPRRRVGDARPIVRVGVTVTAGRLTINVDNTGAVVEEGDREKYFGAYNTTSTDIDAVLGQGMGLGLPITRSLVAEYGGTVKFSDAPRGFATRVQVSLAARASRR